MSDSIYVKFSKLADLKKAKERQVHSSPDPETCGMCSKDLKEEKYYVDGALKLSGAWTYMCPKCFFEHGEGIGLGEGQLYIQETDGSWLLVAGFCPINDGSTCAFCGEEFDKKDLVDVKNGEWMCVSCIEEGSSVIRQVIEQKRNKNTDK